MLSMQVIWTRIEVEFKILHASALWNEFQPGASDADIQETEGFLGITFPDEVKTSYQIHNGSNGKELIGDPGQSIYRLYSFAEMISDWQHQMDVQRQNDQRAALSRQESIRMHRQQQEDGIKKDNQADAEEEVLFGFDQRVRCNPPDRSWWWHSGWIPLLCSASGVRLCLDLAPGPAGQIGQIIKLDFDDVNPCPPVVASSWQALLFTFAQDLEAEEYRLCEDMFGGVFLSFA